jgi:hypothetical protein
MVVLLISVQNKVAYEQHAQLQPEVSSNHVTQHQEPADK